MSSHNPLGDLVILLSFLACWQGAGMSGKAAMRDMKRRQRRAQLSVNCAADDLASKSSRKDEGR